MSTNQSPIQRSHALQRLLRLTPENTDIESLDRFVAERADILAELEAIEEPWTHEEQDILEAAMQHAEEIMLQLEVLHKQIAQQIGGLKGAASWGQDVEHGAQSRIKRRY